MNIRAVVFDVGGVLHTSRAEHIAQDIINTLGISQEQYLLAYDQLMPLFNLGEITEQEFWQQFITLTKASQPLPTESLWGREFARLYQVNDDVLHIVANLKNQGLTVAILSNTIDPHATINRQRGLYAPFEIIILSHEVGLAKPDPKIYEVAQKQLQVSAAETVFVDDREENITAAIKLGINGILFQDAHHLVADLAELGLEI
ncbi:HAD family phosphatase [Patescibacteria group bacterium]|nr:HAD family phosphatase [Patescibacteria group bacterium]